MRRLACVVATAVGLCLLGAATGGHAGQKRQTAVAIPAGTAIEVRLDNQLDTGETQSGQTFTGTVTQPVVVGGKTLLAKGATVKGQVTEVVSSGRLKRPASITLVLSSVSTQPLQIDGKSHLLRNVALIGGGAAAGAAVGGATGGKKGAAIGTAVGAGAGTATAFLTGKQEIVLPAETVLPFVAGSGATASAPATTARAASSASKAPEGGQAYRDTDARGSVERAGEMVQVVFTDRDRQLIHGYYSGGKGLPPGLAKRGGKLPPGLEKQLRKNGTLPPGLQKKVEPFPADLTRQLSPLPSGLSRVMVAGRAIIMDRNHKILDLFTMVQ
jgi:hypothetical protein